MGATVWSPCYYMNASLPSLWDGAVAMSSLGNRIIKLAMTAKPDHDYAWNSNWTATASYTRIAQLAAHPYFDAVFSNAIPGHPTDYQTFVLVAFSWPNANTSDFCQGDAYSAANAAEDTAQFAELTELFMTKYAGRQLRFVLQPWETDWAVRCGGYDPSQPADPKNQAAMIRWLQARQDGVNQGRVAACRTLLGWDGDRCTSDPRGAMAAAGVEVLHATEVNLVNIAMKQGAPENILKVVPYVALDIISYSSYDTMSTAGFGAALAFIEAHHNRTAASPVPGVAIGEYGVAQEVHPLSALQNTTENVAAFTFSLNAQGNRRALYAMFWELMCNEAPKLPGGRCTTATGPVFNPSDLNGFWLIRPDGSKSWAWGYLQGLINGSIPVPTPPAMAA